MLKAENFEGQTARGRRECRGENRKTLKFIIKETGYGGVNWVYLAQDRKKNVEMFLTAKKFMYRLAMDFENLTCSLVVNIRYQHFNIISLENQGFRSFC